MAQMGGYSILPPTEDRQRHQELLEHTSQEEAKETTI